MKMTLQQLDHDTYIRAIEEFHHLYRNMPKDTFPDRFIEWLYTSCWNFAICRLKQNKRDDIGSRAVIISLEGFTRAQVFCHADMEILRERAQRFSDKKP